MKIKKRVSVIFLCIIYVSAIIFSAAGCSSAAKENEAEKQDEIKSQPVNMAEKNDEVKSDEAKGNETKNNDENNANKIEVDINKIENTISVPFESVKYEAKVEPYKVNDDLSNIENLEQFGEFTPEQKKLLAKNGFVVNPTMEEQLFYIYEKNEYKKIPSFITTDSVLQVYHVFYDYSLRTLEKEKLAGILNEFTESMLEKSIILYDKIQNEKIKEIQLKNIEYFCTAMLCLEKPLPNNVPDAAKNVAEKEYKLICEQSGFKQSEIFPFSLDYSQYKPRGHYTRSDELKKFFKAMMWYGQVPFPLYKADETRNVDQTIQALLITYSLFLENDGINDATRWENIYNPTCFYVGNSDDFNIFQYKDLLVSVYGKSPDINKLNNKDKIDLLYSEAEKLPEPAIQGKYTSGNICVGKQFRLMGQRYIPDSEAMQEVVEPIKRPVPSGLDVMGIIGSERAYDILINNYHEDEKWDGYISAFTKMKDKFSKISLDTWQSNMYYGWLWTLKGFFEKIEEGFPSFMDNQAWVDKSLSTALGSWAELRHDTILYGKQCGAECGGDIPPEVKGYVEPSIKVYERLLWLTKYSRKNLEERQLLTGSMESKIQDFEDILQFLINCSVKELRNEELTADEYYQLLTYGGYLEFLTASLADEHLRWFEITSETDKNMAVIADVHTIAPKGCLEVAVGPASEIYVVVPIAGKLYLTRGAVFSYYEFTSPERLTDEQWQKMIKENEQPAQPDWMKSYIRGGKEEIPVPAEPFCSGC